jgi:hypothetical protein
MRLLTTALFVLMSASAFSQISVRYMGAKRAYYQVGDTIHVNVYVKLSAESCLDGMRKTYIYFSGCEDITGRKWRQLPNKVYQKDIAIRITGKAKSRAKVTITRNTDKESFFKQESFNIR